MKQLIDFLKSGEIVQAKQWIADNRDKSEEIIEALLNHYEKADLHNFALHMRKDISGFVGLPEEVLFPSDNKKEKDNTGITATWHHIQEYRKAFAHALPDRLGSI